MSRILCIRLLASAYIRFVLAPMASVAATIPPELFKHILWFSTHDEHGNEPNWWKGTKRAVSLCSQVCRHWARNCRPTLFKEIELRCGDDLCSFKSILRTPPVAGILPIAEFVQLVTLHVDGIEPPWVHLLQYDFVRLLSPKCEFRLDLYVPWEEKSAVRSAKSILSNLPDTLPSTRACITVLRLHNIHFRDRVALCRLISGCRSLQNMYLDDLTWDIPPNAEIVSAASVRALPYLRNIEISCDEGKMLPMWLLPAFAKGNAVGALPEDYYRMCRLFHLWVGESSFSSDMQLGEQSVNDGELC
jgi:hypothetical protein